MLTQPIEFFVAGRPTTQGSKKAFVNPKTGRAIVTEQMGDKLKTWRAIVAGGAQTAMERGDHSVISGPVLLSLGFRLKRPKSHYGTGKNSVVKKGSAPCHPIGIPDLSKLTRAVEDAMKGIVWRDDSQVVVCHHTKAYALLGDPEGVHISIKELEGAE
jgi:Holliday junction resolvase RusA-like endonuclease